MTKVKAAVAIVFLIAGLAVTNPPKARAEANPRTDVPTRPTVQSDGTIQIPDLAVPLSSYMSEEARQRFISQVREGQAQATLEPSSTPATEENTAARIARSRKWVDDWYRSKVERAQALYPVDIEERQIAGVRVHIVTPKSGLPPARKSHALINLHGGGFVVGAVWGGLAESIPIAAMGKFRVITVDYRMYPEYKFPAATEDVASVYKELLKQYAPENIGIYGCSSGGVLAASAVVWFQQHHLPRPGALGIFCAGLDKTFGGDSQFIARMLDVSLTGRPAQPLPPTPNPPQWPNSYLADASPDDPLVWPANSRDVLRRFPATLLITGTRDVALSPAINAHRELLRAGVDADLQIWEGMGHNFLVEMDLPESIEAYGEIARFFDNQLGRRNISKLN